MDLFLYYPDLKIPTEIPTLDYLIDRYGGNINLGDEKQREDLSCILSKWKHTKDNDGKVDNWYTKKQRGFDFIEIRVKRSNILIRFPYYLDSVNNKIIILLGYEKPENFKPGGKIAREVKKMQKLAQEYYNDYHQNRSKIIELPKGINDLINNL